MSRTLKSGCRCKRGHGCKSDPPTRVLRNTKRDGTRHGIREVLRLLANFKFKIPRDL